MEMCRSVCDSDTGGAWQGERRWWNIGDPWKKGEEDSGRFHIWGIVSWVGCEAVGVTKDGGMGSFQGMGHRCTGESGVRSAGMNGGVVSD